MTTEANEEPRGEARRTTGSEAEKPAEQKIPGVPGHLQAAVQQLIGTTHAPKAGNPKRDEGTE